MDKSQLTALFDRDQRIEVTYPGTRREVTPEVVRYIDVSGAGEGFVMYSQLEAANADEVIRAQVRYFESLGQDFEWKFLTVDASPMSRPILEKFSFERIATTYPCKWKIK